MKLIGGFVRFITLSDVEATFQRSRTFLNKGRSLLIFLLVLCFFPLAVRAQVDQGNILGMVTDPTSGTLAGAAIRVTNRNTGIVTSTQTDRTGNYSVPFLPPGTYRIEIEAKGFANIMNPSVELHAQQALRLDFVMRLGSVQEVVSVNAQAPMLQTSSSNTEQTIGTEAINGLPILNQNLITIALLGTGAEPSQNSTSKSLAGLLTFGATVSTNGLRDSMNQFTIDAANVNIGLYNFPGYVPFPDVVQEFTVLTGNYSAEFGQFAGTHINYILKSGTNSFHGDAYEYLQNEDLNTRNYFSPTIPLHRQNQFGGTFGGPIMRNKTFFLVSYQGLRLFTASRVATVVITSAQRAGDLSHNTDGSVTPPFIDPATRLPFSGNQIPGNRISTQAKAILPFDPLPNQPGAVNYATNISTPNNGDGGLVKVDHSFSAQDQLSGRFLINNSTQVNLTPYAGIFAFQITPIDYKNIDLNETHVFAPNVILSTQASWNRQSIDESYTPPPSNLDTRQLFDMPIPSNIAPGGLFNIYPYFSVSGYTAMGAWGNVPLFQRDANYQISSELAVLKGRHNLQFGYEVDRYRSSRVVNDQTNGDLYFSPTNPAGTGNALADFLLGLPNNTTVATAGINVDLRRTAVDLFGTDQWSITPKLTAELGLRYELNVPASEHNGLISLFNFTPPGSFQSLSPGAKLWHGDLNNFAPRFGINYTPRSKDVVRAAGGIYYSTSPQLNLTFAASNPPFITTYNFTSAATAPLSSSNPFPIGQAATGGVPSPFAIQTYEHTPAVYMWMFDLQHSFTPTLLLDIGYVGNRSVHGGRTLSLNVPLVPGPGAIQARRPLPNFGPVTSYQFDSFSTYESLQARIEKRISHGLQLLASYTWSKNLDLASNDLSGGTLIPTNLNFNYGPSDFDVRQNLTVSYLYALPFGEGQLFLNKKGVINEIIGGWQLSGVTTFRSGLPYTVAYPGDVANVGLGTSPVRICNGTLSHPTIKDWFNTSCFVKPAQYTFGNTRRGALFGPGYKNWDIGLMKSFPTVRGQSLQFSAEFFNALNSANFGLPGTTITSAGAGQITSAAPGRVGQIGLVYHY